MTRVAVLGAGTLGQLLAHYTQVIDGLDVVGFLDDTCAGEVRAGLPVLDGVARANAAYQAGHFDALIMGIGYHHLAARQAIYAALSATIPFASLVHPAAWIDPSATVGPGAVVYPGCVVDRGAHVGPNTLLNVGCVVAHDTSLGPHTFLGPGVHLAGFVTVGARCFLGVGTTVIDNITVDDDVQTGGGTVVIQDLAAGLWVGNPARRVR